MRILLSHRYYWPDSPPYARILRAIAEALAARGHEVEVFTCQPSYLQHAAERAPALETSGGVRVFRMDMPVEKGASMPVRALSALRYAWALRRHLRKNAGRYDAVMAATFPPMIAARAAAGARGRAKFVYHFQDIHPEVSRDSDSPKRSLLYTLERWFDARTLAMADAAVVLSEDMANTLRARGTPTPPIHVINNFLPAAVEAEPAAAPPLPQDVFTLVFAGNIGNFQGLDEVIAAAHLLRDEKQIQFYFIGDGAAKGRLVAAAKSLDGDTVHFLPNMPVGPANAYMAAASLNIVSLKSGIYEVSYPSKAIAALSLGAPLLVVMEEHCELSRMVRDEGVGFTAPAASPELLADAIREAFARRNELEDMRARARALVAKRFSRDIVLNRWAAMFEGLLPAAR